MASMGMPMSEGQPQAGPSHVTPVTCCKVAPESWGTGESKVVSSKGLEGYEMFNPRDSRREDREEESA